MPYARHSTDRGKAALMVAALHAALGAALLLGLAGGSVTRVGEAIKSFDVNLPPLPPKPEPPPPQESSSAAKDEAAPPDLKASPAPVVAPKPPIPLPIASPVRTADERAPVEGADPSAGAALVPGPGTGAGGNGTGFGGGGQGGTGIGGGSGAEARLLSGNLARGDYRNLRGYGVPSGRAILALTVGRDGRLDACTPVQGSGSPPLDQALCAILMNRSRWSPALDPSGRPVPVQLRYTAVWNRN